MKIFLYDLTNNTAQEFGEWTLRSHLLNKYSNQFIFMISGVVQQVSRSDMAVGSSLKS